MRNTLETLTLVVMIAINTPKDDHISAANTLVQRISGKVTCFQMSLDVVGSIQITTEI